MLNVLHVFKVHQATLREPMLPSWICMHNTGVDSCTLGMAVSDLQAVYLIKLISKCTKGEMVLATLISPNGKSP